jgi:proteic killer suppression protein
MITDIQNQATDDIFAGVNSKAARTIPRELHRKAKLLLDLLDAAADIQDMASPPGNRLHKLSGDLEDFWSVSINAQYRIIFQFSDSMATQVLITDYH